MGALINVVSEKTDDMLTIKEAADILGAGPSSVSRWVSEGRIKALKVRGSKKYYIDTDELNEFEKYGNYKTRRKARKHADKTMVEILESMDDEQQKAFLGAVGSMAKVLSMCFTGEQLGLVRGTLQNILTGSLQFDIAREAPELMEVVYDEELS